VPLSEDDSKVEFGRAFKACRRFDRSSSRVKIDHENRHVVVRYCRASREPVHWDGLSTLFVVLAQEYPHLLTASDQQWLSALQR
jgi:hypothetical protein